MLALHRRRSFFLMASLLVAAALAATVGGQAQPASSGLQIRSSDHISIIGNALADRMQHDGWLETYFYSRFPLHELVFRNLGFGGDELKTRLRSANFGSPD